MYDKLFNNLNGLNHFKTTISHIEALLGIVEEDYLKNGKAGRTAAINAIVEILESHR